MSSSLGWRYKHSVDQSMCIIYFLPVIDSHNKTWITEFLQPRKLRWRMVPTWVPFNSPVLRNMTFLSISLSYYVFASLGYWRDQDLVKSHWDMYKALIICIKGLAWLTARGLALGQGFFIIHSPLSGASICSVERTYRAQSKVIWLAEYQLNC